MPNTPITGGFNVQVAITDMAALLAFAQRVLRDSVPPSVPDLLRVTFLRPANPPLQTGFEITSAQFMEAPAHSGVWHLDLIATIFDIDALYREATARYDLCWFDPHWRPGTFGEELFEVLVGSNINPALTDIGLELRDYSWDPQAGHAFNEQDILVPAHG